MEKRKMLSRVFTLNDKTAEQVMVPKEKKKKSIIFLILGFSFLLSMTGMSQNKGAANMVL